MLTVKQTGFVLVITGLLLTFGGVGTIEMSVDQRGLFSGILASINGVLLLIASITLINY